MADNPAGVRAGKAGGPHGLRVLSPADPGYVEWCRSGIVCVQLVVAGLVTMIFRV